MQQATIPQVGGTATAVRPLGKSVLSSEPNHRHPGGTPPGARWTEARPVLRTANERR